LDWLGAQGMAAAAVDCTSADIGNAAQMLAHGRLSHVNAIAARLGLRAGMGCAPAAAMLDAAPTAGGDCPEIREGRRVLTPPGAVRRLVLIDSAALVVADDAGQVVVTGSHGALFGGDPANALKVNAYMAVFNDAGGGCGTSRLPALQARGVAAATVAARSARIGDATSTWEDGIVSACNPAAATLGARLSMTARELVARALA
jgi:hypothetical protein